MIKGSDYFALEGPALISDFKLQSQAYVDLKYQRGESLILLENTSILDLGLVGNMNRFYLITKEINIEILRAIYLQALKMIIGQKGFTDFIRILSYNIT